MSLYLRRISDLSQESEAIFALHESTSITCDSITFLRSTRRPMAYRSGPDSMARSLRIWSTLLVLLGKCSSCNDANGGGFFGSATFIVLSADDRNATGYSRSCVRLC